MISGKSRIFATLLSSSVFLTFQDVNAEVFTYGSPVTDQAIFNRDGVIPYLERLEQATDQRVSFRGLFGGTVVQMSTSLAAIENRVVDSGFLIVTFYPSELPFASIMGETTALGTDPIATIGALNEAFFVGCPQCIEDFKRAGQVPLFIASSTPLTIQCTSAVNGAADLLGKRVSVIGSPEARWAELLGMSAVRTQVTDLLVSLQLGKTDCALVPNVWAQSYGLIDVVKGVIEMPQGIASGAVPLSINLDSWRTITPEDRAKILEVTADTIQQYVEEVYIKPDREVRTRLAEVAQVVDGDAEMEAKWNAFQPLEIREIAKLAGERGIDDPEEFAQNLASIYKKWHEVHLPKIKEDPSIMKSILMETIYSKFEF